MRLAKELTPSSPILRNQHFSPNCVIGFLHLGPVLLISLIFPSLPILILFMTCGAKRGSQLSNGLSTAIRTLVFCSAAIRRVLHCRFTSLISISTRPLAMCHLQVVLVESLPLPHIRESPHLEVLSCSVHYPYFKMILRTTKIFDETHKK